MRELLSLSFFLSSAVFITCNFLLAEHNDSNPEKGWFLEHSVPKDYKQKTTKKLHLYVVELNPYTLPPTRPIVRYEIQKGIVMQTTRIDGESSFLTRNFEYLFHQNSYIIGYDHEFTWIFDLKQNTTVFLDLLCLKCENSDKLYMSDGDRIQSFDLTNGKTSSIDRINRSRFTGNIHDFKFSPPSTDNTKSRLFAYPKLSKTHYERINLKGPLDSDPIVRTIDMHNKTNATLTSLPGIKNNDLCHIAIIARAPKNLSGTILFWSPHTKKWKRISSKFKCQFIIGWHADD